MKVLETAPIPGSRTPSLPLAGLILQKLGDWLIVQTVLDHGLELLTSDKDFSKILPCVPLNLVRP